MSPPREIELKLEFPANSIARLYRSSLLRSAKATSQKPVRLVSVYFDTDKLKLRKNGLSLRVRRSGRRHVQTVKRETGANTVLFDRDEWEHDIGGKQPDFDVARGTALEPLLNGKLRRDLRPMFETHVSRKVYPIKSGNSEVDVSFDKGAVAAGVQSSPICELELELKRGDPGELFEIARMLGEEIPVQLSVRSKSERGYNLVAQKEPGAVKTAYVAVSPDDSAQLGFQTIARACLHQVVANVTAMPSARSEALHQMRVGLRRLRTAISLFSDMLMGPEFDALKAEFKWISQELAPARELDVFIKRVVKPATNGKPKGPGIAVLTKDLQTKRRNAFAAAQSAIEFARFRGLALDAIRWIETGQWTRDEGEFARASREQPIADLAADELHKHRQQILKKGKQFGTLEPGRRHKVRIRAKKLRYASDFFAGVFPGKKSSRRRERFVVALERLQDALGELNDITVHERMTEQMVDSHDTVSKGRQGRAKKAFAAGRLSGREEARVSSVLKDAEQAYRAFIKAKPFWS